MSREIKFRFWSKILNHFVIPDDSIYRGAFTDPDMVVLQYIGLKDRDGQNIYEGDILFWQTKENYGFSTKDNYRVAKWNEHRISPNAIVAGNIYENPELLEKGGRVYANA